MAWGPGCAHWGQVEPSAQLRLSPLACNPAFVVPLPHNETCGSDGRFLLACLFEYMF